LPSPAFHLFDYINQLGEVLALFGAERVAVLGIAEGDDKADRGIEVAELTELFIIEPAEDAGAEPLRGGFGGDIGGKDADVDGAIVILFDLGTKGGGGDVGALRDHQHHGPIGGKFIHAHSLRGFGNGLCCFALAHGDMIGLTVTRRGRKARGGKDRIQLFPFHGAGGVIATAGLSLFCNFGKVHADSPFIHPFRRG